MQKTVACVLVLFTGLVGMVLANQQGEGGDSKWEAPADARSQKNPVPASPEVSAQAQTLYRNYCHVCHGPTGKGDGPGSQLLKIPPADLSSPEKQAELTDGEIFWKVTVGRDRMPSFEKQLSDEERWALVHHVRSLKVD